MKLLDRSARAHDRDVMAKPTLVICPHCGKEVGSLGAIMRSHRRKKLTKKQARAMAEKSWVNRRAVKE